MSRPAVPRWAWSFVALYGVFHALENVLVHTLAAQPLRVLEQPVAVLVMSLLTCTMFTLLVRSICLGSRVAWAAAVLWHNVMVATSVAALVGGDGLLDSVVNAAYGTLGGVLLLWYRPWMFAQRLLTPGQRPDLRPLLAALAATVFTSYLLS